MISVGVAVGEKNFQNPGGKQQKKTKSAEWLMKKTSWPMFQKKLPKNVEKSVGRIKNPIMGY